MAEVGVRNLQQFQEQVFDIHLIISPGQAEIRGPFHCTTAGVIQFGYQGFQIDAHTCTASAVPKKMASRPSSENSSVFSQLIHPSRGAWEPSSDNRDSGTSDACKIG